MPGKQAQLSAALAAKILQTLNELYGEQHNHPHKPPSNIYLAYSGGLDSTALLACCASLREQGLIKTPLTAWHINHDLQPSAAAWAAHCQQQAQLRQLAFRADTPNSSSREKHESDELYARRCRYEIWISQLQADDILLQAHHQQDQAETLLLRLLHASPNLTGIPKVRAISSHQPYNPLSASPQAALIARPWLDVSKADLQLYAAEHKLKYIQDPSNQDLRYERNYLRHQILPKLTAKWPAALKSLATGAQNLDYLQLAKQQLQAELLEKFRPELAKINRSPYPAEQILTLGNQRQIADLAAYEFELLIRAWLQQLQLSPPSAAALAELKQQLREPKDRLPLVAWHGGEIRYYQGHIYALPALKPAVTNSRFQPMLLLNPVLEAWLKAAEPNINNQSSREWKHPQYSSGVLKLALVPPAATAPAGCYYLKLELLALGARLKKGAVLSIKFRPQVTTAATKLSYGGRPHKSLKKLLQEQRILPWLRDWLPLVYLNDELIGIVGISSKYAGASQDALATPKNEQLQLGISWSPPGHTQPSNPQEQLESLTLASEDY